MCHIVLNDKYFFSYCNKIFSETEDEVKPEVNKFLPQLFTPNVICAQSKFENQATCHGDSGGPFMMFNSGRRLYVQIGIIAGGLPLYQCGVNNHPTVITLLNHPLNVKFILSMVRKSGNTQFAQSF